MANSYLVGIGCGRWGCPSGRSQLRGAATQGAAEGAHYQYFNHAGVALAWLAQQP
ncbi:MAG: hypothetical protein ACRYFK_11480 [Janthinobacterium lividum]